MPEGIVKQTDIWRTCNKIRAAIFRTGINLWDYYLPLDPNRNHLISESKFLSVLNGPLKNQIGLTDQELVELTNYFRVSDGRVLYSQLCEILQNSVPNFDGNEPFVTGLEWEDPLHENSLSISEDRRVRLLLAKIASVVNLRRLILRPYFQDYELISKNNGVVTISHFARILSYLNVQLCPEDFNLLVKKFGKDSYTINYVVFLESIEKITRYLDDKKMLDLGGEILDNFPGRLINAELPKLPRPEIGNVDMATAFGKQNVFHPILNPPVAAEQFLRVMQRVQTHVLRNRIKAVQFFECWDDLNCGRVTVSQFRRGLDAIGLSAIHRLFLSEREIEMIIEQYKDPNDPFRVCYKTFCDDVNQVFDIKGLEKFPKIDVETPQRELLEIPRKGAKKWQEVPLDTRDLCEETLLQIKRKAISRRINIKASFEMYDRLNHGYVTRSQFRQSIYGNGFLLTEEELYALERRYLDDLGFNYYKLIKDIEFAKVEEPLYNEIKETKKLLNKERTLNEPHRREKDIVEILAKIKGKVVRERINVLQFLEKFDPRREFCISKENFWRGLSVCRFDLSDTEMETLMEVFKSPNRENYVDYQLFADTVEECFTQGHLEKAPLIVPLQHIPSLDNDRNFLNFEERHILSMSMEKIASISYLNLEEIFRDFDRCNCGTISKQQFMKALCVRKVTDYLSSREIEVITKCYGIERGLRQEFDYRAFEKGLDLLKSNVRRKPF